MKTENNQCPSPPFLFRQGALRDETKAAARELKTTLLNQGMTGHSSRDTCDLQKQCLCWPNFWFCCFLIESKFVR